MQPAGRLATGVRGLQQCVRTMMAPTDTNVHRQAGEEPMAYVSQVAVQVHGLSRYICVTGTSWMCMAA